ncbi:unnamed protein product [Meloidogyne enterolobii]|uniref:Uncharacterized protein n=1 Tax=Meloidogyne enterolobii TaxID=390850 RepID=A0ACB0YM74_MELEN
MKIKYLKNIFIFVFINVYFVYSIGINHLNRMAIQHNNGHHLGGNIPPLTQTHLNNHFPTTTISQTNSLNNNFNLPSPTISPFSTINPLSEEQNKQIQHSSPSQTSTLRNSLNQIPSTPLISQSSSTFPQKLQTNNFQPLFTPTPQITKFTKQNVDEQFGQIPTPQTPTIGRSLQKTSTNPQFVEQNIGTKQNEIIQGSTGLKDHSTLAPHQLQTHSITPLKSTEFHHHQQQQFNNPSITTPTHSQHTSTPPQHPSWPTNEETIQNLQNTQVVSPHTSSLSINPQQQNLANTIIPSNSQLNSPQNLHQSTNPLLPTNIPLQESFLNEGESTTPFSNHQNIPSNTQQNNLNTNLPLNNQKLINNLPLSFSQNQNIHLANTVIPSQLNSPQNLHQSTNPLLNTNKSPTFINNQLPQTQPQNNSPETNFKLPPNLQKLNSQELISSSSSPSTSKNNLLNKQNFNQNMPKTLFNGRESTINNNQLLTTSTHPHKQNNSQNTSPIHSPIKNKLETNSQTLNSQQTQQTQQPSQINSNINTTTLLSTLSSNNSFNSQHQHKSNKQSEKQNIITNTPTNLFSNQTKNQNLKNNKINKSNEENHSKTINNFRNLNNSKEKNHKNPTQINNETTSKQNLSSKEKNELNKNKLFVNNNETSTTRTENLNTNNLKENTSNIDKNEFNKFGKIENKNKINNLKNETNNNNLILNATTALPTTTLPQKITTTTQDPIIRKELEKVGAPEILKQMVPPKLEPVKLPEIAKKNIESICANRKCLGQKQEFKEQRAVVVKQEQAVELKLK